jgi:hypothetical protein
VLVLGVVSFSWAYIITGTKSSIGLENDSLSHQLVPSWVNEKQHHVSVNKTVWISTLIGCFLKFSFGYLAAIAFINKSGSPNILNGIFKFILLYSLGVWFRRG